MSSAQMIKDMADGKPAAAYDQFAAAIQPAVEKHIEDLQAQVREKMFDIEEHIEEGLADFSIAQLRKVVQALPGRAFRNMDYELLIQQEKRAAKKLTLKDVETFLKDAEGLTSHIEKGQLKYYKSLLAKLKIYTGKNSEGKSPTFDDGYYSKKVSDDERSSRQEHRKREAIKLMRKIANYISKIKTNKDGTDE